MKTQENICPICGEGMRVVMVDDNVGCGIHEEYECPTHCED